MARAILRRNSPGLDDVEAVLEVLDLGGEKNPESVDEVEESLERTFLCLDSVMPEFVDSQELLDETDTSEQGPRGTRRVAVGSR